jgi:hypothetical protein
LTHSPPWDHLDGALRSGCSSLAREIARVRPRLVVFGHIHVGYGKEEVIMDRVRSLHEGLIGGWEGWDALLEMGLRVALRIAWARIPFMKKGEFLTTFVNAAVVGGGAYEYRNPPIVVQI